MDWLWHRLTTFPYSIFKRTYLAQYFGHVRVVESDMPYKFEPPADLGHWPLRLLHVPSMTSHEWRPGNVYGRSTEPKYATVSYTWGRFELRGATLQPHSKALKIKGVSWKIPRIDEQIFTTAQFKSLIQSTIGLSGDWSNPVQWVWLDVACIDQTPNSPKKAFEIGRQTDIFENALYSVMWLHSLSLQDIKYSIEQWRKANRSEGEERTKFLLESISILLADPWFSSLWTIQEFFICREHYFCPVDMLFSADLSVSDPEDVPRDISRDVDSIILLCSNLYTKGALLDQRIPSEETQLIELAMRCGLMNKTHMPLSLYLASHRRSVSHQTDRIYGIMQIFRFRLGISDPQFDPTTTSPPTTEELEVQFGRQLLVETPFMSQAHIHSGPVKAGAAWRISESSVALDMVFYKPWRLWKRYWNSLATFDTVNIERNTWGHFSGYVCDFTSLTSKWKRCYSISRQPEHDRKDVIYQVLLDHGVAGPMRAVHGDLDSGTSGLEKLLLSLEERKIDIRVLIVGYMRRHNESSDIICDETMGLLIRKDGNDGWRRLGICFWGYWGAYPDSNEDILHRMNIFLEDRHAAATANVVSSSYEGHAGYVEGPFG